MVYFVATPIGNLSEMSYRAVETLKSVAAIFCEDLSVTLTETKKTSFLSISHVNPLSRLFYLKNEF